MKAKLASKSVVSLILTLLLVVSMVTIGIVNASSAEVEIAEQGAELDIAETGAGVIEVWFTRPNSWGNTPNVHYWGGASSSSWPGKAMTYKETNSYSQSVYYTTVPGDTKNIIFNNGNGSYQTVDIVLPSGNTVVAYYVSANEQSKSAAVTMWQDIPAPSGGGTTSTEEPTAAPSTEYTVYFADNTDSRWIPSDNAKIYVGDTELKKSIDEHTGWIVWSGKIAVANNSSVTFKRVSAIDKTKIWNQWTGTFNSGNPCYVATGYDDNNNVGQGHWGTAPTLPAGTITDFFYGIWVDTKGNGNVNDCVKIYAKDYNKDSKYTLYLPAYTDWNNLKVYTSFETLTLNNTAVVKGQVNTMDLHADGVERVVPLTFKRYDTDSAHTATLHIMRGGTASTLFMSTKDDLYTGLTAAYAVKEDGTTPDYDGVAAYKESVSTKGDYMFYDKTGALLNPTDKTTGEVLTGLKKVKARGNSTFEASMRLYGKTAYNITLNDKAPLIEGCAESKKYSLLANNADESLLRNATVYGIADEVGMPYTPNTRLIDLYDNGTYLGAYVLTEKVEYGKNTLIPDAKSADKANEEILAAGKGIDYDGLKQTTATYTTTRGNTYTYQYSYDPSGKVYEYDGTTVTIGEGEAAETYTLNETLMKKYDFLLEHEIETRYSVEPTWFRSNRTKQALVPKYPEFATQNQVKWMIEQYDALEDAAYDGDYNRVQDCAKVETFADVYLIQELTMNLDACATSYYILGGKTYPKLVAAPLWDYDWAAGQYNGSRRVVPSQTMIDVADTSKVYVKNKSVSTGEDGRDWNTYNLQAKLCHLDGFWTLCKSRWTNQFVPVLNNWLGDGMTLLDSKLPEFTTAAYMNNDRWSVLDRNYSAAHGSNPAADTWGTRSTYAYKKGSYGFGVGQYYPTQEVGVKSYANTVYYLNDWLTKRMETMSSSTFGLYDASMIETEPPTDPPTDAPTDPPTDAPTDPPTDAPEDTYILGDTDGDGIVTVTDATMIQRICADYTYPDQEKAEIRGKVTSFEDLTVIDATAIQRYLADYTVPFPINQVFTYPKA